MYGGLLKGMGVNLRSRMCGNRTAVKYFLIRIFNQMIDVDSDIR